MAIVLSAFYFLSHKTRAKFQWQEQYSDGRFFADINIKGTSKGNAIDELYKIFNIQKEETICFGDSRNDLSMFESSGIKVAMKNGSEEIKQRELF